MENKKCIEITSSGNQCGAYAIKGSDYCFMHDPTKKEQMDIARSLGGRSPKFIEGMPVLVDSPNDILVIVSKTIGNLMAMPISINQQKTILLACETASRILELRDFSERINLIEEQLGLKE
jgi:hypothetical protein